jgi:hypothetical protein
MIIMINHKHFKLQSAMEYMMTYGWSLLIIAIVVIGLYSLGVFGGGGTGVTTSCLVQAGYVCQGLVLHGNTLTIGELGQNTGANWVGVNVLWVPEGQVLQTNTGAYTWCPSYYTAANEITNTVMGGISCYTVSSATGALNTAAQISPTFTFTSNVPVGPTVYSGALWIEYQTVAGGSVYETQLAKVTLERAT